MPMHPRLRSLVLPAAEAEVQEHAPSLAVQQAITRVITETHLQDSQVRQQITFSLEMELA